MELDLYQSDLSQEPDNLSDACESNASYLPSLSYQDIDGRSLLAPQNDLATRPTTYSQLIDFLKMLSVPILERSDVVLGRKIGVGRSFLVQEGRMRDTFPHISVVAVKTSVQSIHLAEYRSSLIKEIIDEIRVMSHLARHRNVAHLVGVILERTGGSDDGGPFLPRLIVERAVGSLAGLLADYRHSGRLPWALKLKLALDTAAGLEALHLINIVHGDVKADNVLVFDNLGDHVFIAKVSDFGFCVPDTSWRDTVVAIRGTLRFQAPEALIEAPPRLQVHSNLPQRDIYSFGVLLWEVITNGRVPFVGVADGELSHTKLSNNEGAAEHLIVSLKQKYDAPSVFIEALTATIRGTVRREPTGEGGRLAWQAIFDILCAVVNDEVKSFFESRWKDFGDFSQRQPEMAFSGYRDFPWLPTIPELSKTWLKADQDHSKLMLKELQESSAKTCNYAWRLSTSTARHNWASMASVSSDSLLEPMRFQ
ncbi:kinase-like protein [Athelia psychrophila]|uniref:Kinase-like protein n=1 Tax=Athelia psychrophila TaxID=1759441 RepID=A0A165ZYR4_9AGAM|nr:kinase-like protein [Fibularhizoctonia sp. CBS 109695]